MRLVIIGAGGFGREILGVLDDLSTPGSVDAINFLGFLDDGEPDTQRLTAIGEKLLGRTDLLAGLQATYLIGIGAPRTRGLVDQRARESGGASHPAVVHRSASIGRAVQLSEGSVICAQTVITTNVEVGRHLHLNLCSTIGHDCRIGDYVTIAPSVNISGNVHVGHEVEFGTGAKVLPGVTIGDGATVGAGAVVVRDVDPGDTVVGVPARPLNR